MEEHRHKTELGTIVYWVSYAQNCDDAFSVETNEESSLCNKSAEELSVAPDAAASVMFSRLKQNTPVSAPDFPLHPKVPKAPWLVFLPGLTADHRLFNRQLSYFAKTANCFVWDPPAHGKSRPFKLDFSMNDLAIMLHDILKAEQIENPILVGQSMGGYISQAFLSLFPGYAKGFVSIDSAPLACSYYHKWEIAALKHTKSMYSSIPWGILQRMTARGCSTTLYGQSLMRKIVNHYNKKDFCELAAHGYKILADAIEKTESESSANPFGKPNCPTLLLWGENDQAAMAKKYNQQWALKTGLSFVEIPRAGHNSNTDAPDEVNRDIEIFVSELER